VVYCRLSTRTGKGAPVVRQPETPTLAAGPVKGRTAFRRRKLATQTPMLIVNFLLIRFVSPNVLALARGASEQG